MIAKQSIGTSFLGALNYNLKKMYAQAPNLRAELLDTNFVSLNQYLIKRELSILRDLNPRLKRNTYHTSLNFATGETISNQKMLEIAQEYMGKMGFDNNAYFIFRHHDSSHPHCHILCLRNRFDGTVVSDSNNFKRSEEIVRELEIKHGLTIVEDSQKAMLKAPNKDELEMVIRTGKASQRMLMQEKVSQELQRSSSLADLIQNLEKKGIHLLFNQASTGRVSGITYMSKDFKAKGQALGNQFKWSNIKKSINYEQVRDSQEISAANHRTKSIFGESAGTKQNSIGLAIDSNEGDRRKNHFFEERSKHNSTGSLRDHSTTTTGIRFDQTQHPTVDQDSTRDTDDSSTLLSHATDAITGLGGLLGNLSPAGSLEKDRKKKKNLDEELGR